MEKNKYLKKGGPVKAHYTIRANGRIYRVRMSHLQVLAFLRHIWPARRVA